MQFKKILAYALTVCLLLSLTVPAYAVDEVYTVSDDASALSAPIFYTLDYYPGAVSEMRSSGLFANPIAHGSYSELNYNPSWFYKSGSSTYPSGDFNALTPSVTADQTDVSGIYYIPNTTFLSGTLLSFRLPNTRDCYFDFQSSNFLFDQQSPQANTFYINGDLTFSLRNLWSFNGSYESPSFYLASDPLAVQLVIDGKAYGDIIDVTSYTSPFTSLYMGGVPANASVTFDNLKVYYQGDTPDMIGFRVYTGSAFTDGQYNYNNAGEFVAVDVTNTITFRCSEIPDITFVQEGGDGYAGDLSGISALLSSIQSVLTNGFNSVSGLLQIPSGKDVLSALGGVVTSWEPMSASDILRVGLIALYRQISQSESKNVLSAAGTSVPVEQMSLIDLTRVGFLGLRSLMVNSTSGKSYLQSMYEELSSTGPIAARLDWLYDMTSNVRSAVLSSRSYVADTVFPWQSYNMETHQLNAATNITGQNNLFFTAFQSMEDKLGRLAYVFGSDEDLALKDSADPGTDAFRENFGGGLSFGQIKDGADVVAGVNGLFDSGYSFGDAFTEIAGEAGFFAWFTPENAAALDSTGSVMALDDSDPYNMQIYYDHIQSVKEKREAGDD